MKKLHRSRINKKIAGVCGGFGEYFNIDPAFIRLLVLFFCFLTGIIPVLIAYFIVALIVPIAPLEYHVQKYVRLYRSKKNKMIAGVCGGLANFFEVDATIVRLVFVVMMIATAVFPLLITYIIAWSIISED